MAAALATKHCALVRAFERAPHLAAG